MKQPRDKNGRFARKNLWAWVKWVCAKLGKCKS